MPTALILLILTVRAAAAAEPALVPPAGPLEAREYCQVLVQGLTDADLQAARVEWSPTAGTTLVPARLWGGQPFLWFSARQPGKYTITLTLHGWRRSLDAAVADLATAGVQDAAAVQLRQAAQQLATRYPLTSASCVLEVAGAHPPEPTPTPDPQPPPNPPPSPKTPDPAKHLRVTYVYERDSTAVPRPVAAALAALNRQAITGGRLVVASEFERNTVDGDGDVPAQYATAVKAAAEAGLPCLVLDQAGTVFGVVKAPTTSPEVLDAVEACYAKGEAP